MLLRRRKQQAEAAETNSIESYSTVANKTQSLGVDKDGVNSFNMDWMLRKVLAVEPQLQPKVAVKPARVGEPVFIKINLKLNRQHLPKEENLEFIDFSQKDGYPVFKYWGDVGYLANLYPIEELIQTKTQK